MSAPHERRGADARARGAVAITRATAAAAAVGLTVSALWLAFGGGGTTLAAAAPVGVALGLGLLVVAAAGTLAAVPGRDWPGWPALGAAVALPLVAVGSLAWTESRSLTAASSATWTIVGATFVIAAVEFRGPGPAALGLASVILVPLAIALVVEEHLLAGATSGIFLYSRLSYPMDYANGAAALVFIGAPAAAALAASRALAAPLRIALAGIAGLLVATGGLALSRGGTLALVIALIVLLAFAPNRPSAALVVVALALAMAGAYPFLFHETTGSGTDRRAIGIIIATAIATFGGAIAVALGGPLDAALRRRGVRTSLVVASTLVAAAAIVRFAPALPRLLSDFRRPPSVAGSSLADQKARFDTARSNRYQYWSVAYHTWRAHPLGGVGAGAFAIPWYRERTIPESTTDPHGWPFQLASEEGLLGIASMLVFVGSLLAAAVACRRRGGAAAVIGAACASTCAYFFAHAAVDWLFSMSSVYVIGMTAAGALVGAAVPRPTRLAGLVPHAGVLLAAAATLSILVPTWASLTYLRRGEATPQTEEAVAILNRSHRWNPLATDPLLAEADIEATAGAARPAIAVLHKAIAADPRRWELWIELAGAQQALHRPEAAARSLARAHALNPLEISAG